MSLNKNNLPTNEYYICLKGNQKPIRWDISNSEPNINLDCSLTYFARVFEVMEKNLNTKGLIFYLTWENLDRLPSYGQNVVAIVLGDEWCRIPKYYNKVRAVFKCYGTRPTLGFNPFLKLSHLNIMFLLKFIQVWTVGIPGQFNYKLQQFKSERLGALKIVPIYHIPLGYFKQVDMPIKEIENRPYDVFFAGSVEHASYSVWSLKYWLKPPKDIARKKMMFMINFIRKKNLDVKFNLTITSDFNAARCADEKSYSEKMMDSKICLVPRGTSLETYRFFEAIRYGCIVITEILPSRWFYNGSPAIRINDWSELEEILDKLINNKLLIKKKHQESLAW